MTNKLNDAILDAYINLALEENMRKELQDIPPKEELDKMFPVQKKYRNKILKAIKKNKHNGSTFAVYLKRVAVIALICFSSLFGGLLTNQNVRAAIKETVLEWYDKYIRFNFEASIDDNNFPTAVNDVDIQYIPDGFNIEYQDDAVNSKQFIYFNEEGNELVVDIMQNNVGAIMVDNENQTYEELIINDRNVHFFYDNEENYGIGIVGNNKCVVSVQGHLPREELLKIFENIK